MSGIHFDKVRKESVTSQIYFNPGNPSKKAVLSEVEGRLFSKVFDKDDLAIPVRRY
jgi:hypothetical protein